MLSSIISALQLDENIAPLLSKANWPTKAIGSPHCCMPAFHISEILTSFRTNPSSCIEKI